MIATFEPCNLTGIIDAPPSKSMAHRYLIGAALSKENCILSGIDYSEDILATIDCLRTLGAKIEKSEGVITVEGFDPKTADPKDALFCRESGSTMRFIIPIAALCEKRSKFAVLRDL